MVKGKQWFPFANNRHPILAKIINGRVLCCLERREYNTTSRNDLIV